jgi:hypothetical protein
MAGYVKRRETPAITGHLESLTPTLSPWGEGVKPFFRGFYDNRRAIIQNTI